jgi:pyruvate-formate lyase-activating enzyme
MHLMEMAHLRNRPAAGLFLALTRRCPLSCAHCSTDSSLSSEQHSATPFRRLVASFTPQTAPEVLLMSGGEALLRADLVRELAITARAAGCRSYLLSGMYFARGGHRIPEGIRRTLSTVDHLAMSLDEFHEREVSRREVFDAVHRIRDLVPHVSFQLTGRGDDDPYLEGLVHDVRREFDDAIPILVGLVHPVGRAAQWLAHRPAPLPAPPAGVDPCDRAGWPLVTYDGTMLGCCNQDLVERARPAHLIVGHARAETWPELRARFLTDPMLRTVRSLGPRYAATRFGPGPQRALDQCGACLTLADPATRGACAGYVATPGGSTLLRLAEDAVTNQGPLHFSLRSSPRYGDLVALGWEAVGATTHVR